MDGRLVVVVALLAAVAGVATPAATAASTESPADRPTIAVAVDGLPLDAGDVYHTATDPWIRVSASSPSAEPLSLIEIRVDGETRHVVEPDAETVERNVVLDLERGRHRVRVVAKGDGVATHAATVVLDDAAPVINYSTPFAPDATPDDPSVPPSTGLTVSRGNVTLNGTLTDHSTVEYVRVRHDYDYRRVGADDADLEGREKHFVASPGTGFEQSLDLAPGDNRITVSAEDAVGNVRTHDVTIVVDDGTAPRLELRDVEWVSPTRLHVEGRVRDRVQVQSVWLEGDDTPDESREIESRERHPLIFPRPTVPDGDRRAMTVDTTVYHPPDADYVVLGANDTAGNERTWNYSLSTFLAPNVTVDDRRTGYVDGETVAVGGRVTGGQVADVSVETVDPDTGAVVDIRPVDLAADGSFGVRLAGVADRTRVRVRVRDASGAEHRRNATVSAPAPAPATPAGDGSTPTDDGAGDADAPTGSEAADAGPSGIRIPFVGVVVPVPTLGVPAPLGAAVSVPLPLLGSVDVPVLAVAGPALLVVAVGAVRRR
jgi:hypothetical protein